MRSTNGRVGVGLILSVLCASGLSACGDAGTMPGGQRGPIDLGGFVQENPDLAKDAKDLSGPDMAQSNAPANAACAAPTAITTSVTLANEDTTLATTTLGNVCLSGAGGAALFYSVSLPAGSRLVLTASPTDGVFDPVIRVLSSCTATSCEDTVDNGYEGDAETLSHVNAGSSAQTLLVAVAGYEQGMGGTFDLEVQIGTVAVNALCSSAVAVTAGSPMTALDSRQGGDSETACLDPLGATVYYSTTIPARSEVSVTVTPSGTASMDPTIQLISMCGAFSCLASADDTLLDAAETATYRNTSMMPKPILIAVAGYDPGGGTFDLEVTNAPLPPPPMHASCAQALGVQDGDSLVGEDAGEATEALTDVCDNEGAGKVLYYAASIPANHQLRAIVNPTGSWDPIIRLLPSCGSMTCLGSADNGGAGTNETLTYKNTSASSMNVIVAVGSYGANSTGLFDLDVEMIPLPAPPMNQICAQAVAMTDGQTVTGQNLASGNTTLSSVCLPEAIGNVLYYTANVPAGHRLVARGAPTDASWDLALRVMESCTATSCLSSADTGYEGKEEVVSYKNTGASAQSVIVAVGSYTSAIGLFDLSTWIKPTPTYTTCAQARVVTNGTSLTAEDGESGTVSLASNCVQFGTGKVLFYSATIAQGKTLTATVTPIGAWDPIIRLLSACNATTCLASKDTGSDGVPESLTYTNSGSGPITVQIAVGGYDVTRSFNLQVAIQ